MWRHSPLVRSVARLKKVALPFAMGFLFMSTGVAGYCRTKSLMQTVTELPRSRLHFRAQLAYELRERGEAQDAIRRYCNILELAGPDSMWWIQKEKTFCLLMLATTLETSTASNERDALRKGALKGCRQDSDKCNAEALMRRLSRLYPNSPWLNRELDSSQSTSGAN